MELPVKPQKRSYQKQFGTMTYAALLGLIVCVTHRCAAQQTPRPPVPPPRRLSQHRLHPAADQGPETLRIVVGHSLVVRTPSRVKRILTGNPAVLESVMTSPNEVVLTAKQTGGSSLVLWEENGQSRMIDIFADLDVTSLRNAFEQSYPGSNVEAQSQEGKVVLVGVVPSAATAEQMLKMATNFSKEVVNGLQIAQPPRLKQVMLKVRFAEADRGKLTAFGINLFSTGATNTIGTVSTQQFGAAVAQLAESEPATA